MRRIAGICRVVLPVLAAAIISISLAGCGKSSEPAKSEHPTGEHPSKVQPSKEEPPKEHPTAEHPK